MEELKKLIRDVEDFPKKGIIFKDITTLLNDKNGFKKVIDLFYERYKDKKIDYVIGAESRGFIFGTPLAYKLNAGFIPIRKKGKLPYKTHSISYDLEYGQDTLEIHEDAAIKNSNVLLIDDLLATGGTAKAMIDLTKKLNVNIIEISFLIELKFLEGSKKLDNFPYFSLLSY
jgi:adenine phosphoribosyltransferase